jgi:hypothetical protein
MPIESIVVVTLICTAFIGFAAVLAWASNQTAIGSMPASAPHKDARIATSPNVILESKVSA